MKNIFSDHNLPVSAVFIFLAVMLSACAKLQITPAKQLEGDWTLMLEMQPKGKIIYEINFSSGRQFKYHILYYGTYDGQNIRDSSATYHIKGNYTTENNSLNLFASKRTWWDKFYNAPPRTDDIDGIVFEKATYTIKDDTLILNYTSYPADAPVSTQMKLKRGKSDR